MRLENAELEGPHVKRMTGRPRRGQSCGACTENRSGRKGRNRLLFDRGVPARGGCARRERLVCYAARAAALRARRARMLSTSVRGVAANSVFVYSCFGSENTSSRVPYSTHSPKYITITSSEM